MSTQASPPPTQKRARRLSKFVEGSPATGAELLQQTVTSNELFFNILSEMDEFEKKRQHRGSSSSVDSLVFSNGSLVKDRRQSSERDGRKSADVGRPSLEGVRKMVEEKKRHNIVGRLRALTGGQKEVKGTSYPGT